MTATRIIFVVTHLAFLHSSGSGELGEGYFNHCSKAKRMAHRNQRQVSWGEMRSPYEASHGYTNQTNRFSVTRRESEPGTCSFVAIVSQKREQSLWQTARLLVALAHYEVKVVGDHITPVVAVGSEVVAHQVHHPVSSMPISAIDCRAASAVTGAVVTVFLMALPIADAIWRIDSTTKGLMLPQPPEALYRKGHRITSFGDSLRTPEYRAQKSYRPISHPASRRDVGYAFGPSDRWHLIRSYPLRPSRAAPT
jgi:hypothetical protein